MCEEQHMNKYVYTVWRKKINWKIDVRYLLNKIHQSVILPPQGRSKTFVMLLRMQASLNIGPLWYSSVFFVIVNRDAIVWLSGFLYWNMSAIYHLLPITLTVPCHAIYICRHITHKKTKEISIVKQFAKYCGKIKCRSKI